MSAKITFIGDIMPHSAILESCRKNGAYNFDGLFKHVLPYLHDCDYLVANPEFGLRATEEVTFEGDANDFKGSLNKEDYPYVILDNTRLKTILISCPKELLDYLINVVGINLFTLANNHALDCGTKCLEEFKRILSANNCDYIGTPNTDGIIKEINGFKIGFYNSTHFSKSVPEGYYGHFIRHHPNEERLLELRKDCDILIVVPHWGIEYTLGPTDYQTRCEDLFKRCNADYIIGGHAHSISKYCLGNFICGRDKAESRLGSIVTVTINEDGHREEAVVYTWCAMPETVEKSFAVVPVEKVISGDIQMEEKEKNIMIKTFNTSFNNGNLSILPILKY